MACIPFLPDEESIVLVGVYMLHGWIKSCVPGRLSIATGQFIA
jgi:hypothetical protein